MPTTPWRCSQCGTVNEPVANSCRTCGRWPSLFDLQDGAVGEDAEAQGPVPSQQAVLEAEPVRGEPEPAERTAPDVLGDEHGRPEEIAPPRRLGPMRGLARLIIPIGVLLYFLLSSYFSR